MRIHKVTFCNLNSLEGKHTINFDDPKLRQGGLFLITGETGSGKTTILDAITLALFGCTARLKKINKNTNSILSHGCSFCSAEVVFSEKGHTYRAFWSQKRSHGKAEGALQDPIQELSEGTKVLNDKRSEFLEKIEEVTKLDFNRFTQAVLLSQGKFASFLQAEADERAPILEQITKTEIYSDISIAVFQRQKKEKETLDKLKSSFSEMEILDENERKELLDSLQALRKQSEDLTKEREKLLEMLTVYEKITQRETERTNIAIAQKALLEDQKNFADSQKKLDLFHKGQSLAVPYAQLGFLRQERKKTAISIDSLSQRKELLAQEEEKAQKSFEEADRNNQAWLKDKENWLTILAEVKALDSNIEECKENCSTLQQKAQERESSVLTDQKNLSTSKMAYDEELKNKEELGHWIEDHQTDKNLENLLSGLKEKENHLKETSRQIEDCLSSLSELGEEIENAKHLHEIQESKVLAQKQRFLELSQQKEALETELATRCKGETLASLQNCKDTLGEARIQARLVASLEEQRKNLKVNEPCPLCGSLEHPYAKGLPTLDDQLESKIQEISKLIDWILTQQEYIRKNEEEAKTARKELEKLSEQLVPLDDDLKQSLLKEKQTKAQEEALRKVKEQVILQLLEQVKTYGISQWDEATFDLLENRAALFKTKSKEKDSLEFSLKARQGDIKNLQTQLASDTKNWEEAKDTYRKKGNELAKFQRKRTELFGQNEVKTKQEEIKRKSEEYSNQNKAQAQAWSSIHDEYLSLLSQLKENLTRLGEIKLKEEKEQSLFLSHLSCCGFESEQSYLDSLLDARTLASLQQREKELADTQSSLKDRSSRLAGQEEIPLPVAGKETLSAQLEENQRMNDKTNESIGVLKEKLSADEKVRASALKQGKLIGQQQKIFEQWNILNELIGSSDGKKFRNFAQSLTFQKLIRQANMQLQKLSDRYLLCTIKEEPLDFFVEDFYQGDTIRTTKNLSGGESFIVSLALALGLSSWSSSGMRIDSLFLDEGFGTLDPHTIETALNALTSLEQNEKTIGIISHVTALKDRIPNQIEVLKLPGGRSTLRGIGVEE
ncbi:MAG: AAA family ATPase [Sphaerochaetaceae bacterium]